MHWYVSVLRKYAVFSGRASRREFWMFCLVHIAIGVGLVIGFLLGEAFAYLFLLYQAALLLPTVSVFIRRFHDSNRSGWWILVVFIPFIGGIVVLALAATAPDPNDNKYGPAPEMATAAGVVGETVLECPHCGAPYNPGDYRPDTLHIYCSVCRGEIERSPGPA